jgi:hypothetical protein
MALAAILPLWVVTVTNRTTSKPSPADIVIAIGRAEAGDWIDPSEVPINWECILYDPEGERVGDGNAETPQLAMALAWVHCWAPDALTTQHVELGAVPFHVPAGWRFELTPPWKSK